VTQDLSSSEKKREKKDEPEQDGENNQKGGKKRREEGLNFSRSRLSGTTNRARNRGANNVCDAQRSTTCTQKTDPGDLEPGKGRKSKKAK